jgi:L-asparagine transporter-like permease
MQRNTIIVLAVVLVAFVAIGGFLIFRQTGGGGQNRTFDMVVNGGTMTPSSVSAKQGDNITMSFTTDKAEEIHLHGFDLMFQGEPGKKVTKSFKADRTCDCEIEIEETSTHLGSLTVSP